MNMSQSFVADATADAVAARTMPQKMKVRESHAKRSLCDIQPQSAARSPHLLTQPTRNAQLLMRQLDTLLQRVQSEYGLRLAAEERLQALMGSQTGPRTNGVGAEPTGAARAQTASPSQHGGMPRARRGSSALAARAGTWSPPQGDQGGLHAAAGHSHKHAAGQGYLRSTSYRAGSAQRSRSVSPRGSIRGRSRTAAPPHQQGRSGGSVYSLEDVPPLGSNDGARSVEAALREEIAALRSELDDALAAGATAAAQLQDTVQQVEDGQLALAERGAELRQLRAELVAARQAARSSATRAKDAQRATADAKAREESLKTRLEAVRAAMNKHEKAAARSAKLSQRCSNAEEQSSRLRSTVGRLRRQLDEAHAREKALQSQAAMEGRAMRTVLARADALLGEQVHMQQTLRNLEQELEETRGAEEGGSIATSVHPPSLGTSVNGADAAEGAVWDMDSAASRSPPRRPGGGHTGHHGSSAQTPIHESAAGTSAVSPASLAASNAALAAALADSQARQADAESRVGQLRGTVRVLRGRLAESHEHRQALMGNSAEFAAPAVEVQAAPHTGQAAEPSSPPHGASSARGDRSPLRFPAADGEQGSDEGDAAIEAAQPSSTQSLSAAARALAWGDGSLPSAPQHTGRQLSGYAADNEGVSSAESSDGDGGGSGGGLTQQAGDLGNLSGYSEPTPHSTGPPQPVKQSSPDASVRGAGWVYPQAAPGGFSGMQLDPPLQGWQQPWAPPSGSAAATPRPWAPPMPSAVTPAPAAAAPLHPPAPQRASGLQPLASSGSGRRKPTTQEDVQAGMALLRALMAEQEQ